ncbi:MAG: formylglycine-generating enzyme family protein [Candidatus Zixiibacteriota bacterium]|nr:MAG: formylglycine-generating enzyme family protein [candidate division Zixibacteria bacterium]
MTTLTVLIALLLPMSGTSAAENGTTTSEVAVELVLIPGGEFLMGDSSDGDHAPAHAVHIDSFYIDRYEVTNAQFYRFCEETGHQLPEFWGKKDFHSGPDFPDYPVVGVSWSDAAAYAEWAGKRLPTEAEWEYAARGGLIGKRFPLGGKLDSTQANFTVGGVAKGLVPAGSYPPNGYGLYDMAGNVVEWVFDRYSADYYAVSPGRNPQGPESGKFRVIRGGGWHSGPSCCRVYFRNALPANWRDFNVGFRCARDLK